ARAAGGIAHHCTVARLEDVERERQTREEDDVRKREDGNDVGQLHRRTSAAGGRTTPAPAASRPRSPPGGILAVTPRPETRSRAGWLETECTHARAGTDAIDPGLHVAERRLELDPQPSEHHDPWCEGRVGERELLTDEELLTPEVIAQEVE